MICWRDAVPALNTNPCRDAAAEGEVKLFQWLIVCLYVMAMFLFAGDEVSSSTFTGRLLKKWLPWLGPGEIRHWVFILRKLGHLAAYALLTVIVHAAARRTPGLRRAALTFALGFALLVAVFDESYQKFLIHRTGSWTDVLIDGAGVALAGALIFLRRRRKEKTNLEVTEDVENEWI